MSTDNNSVYREASDIHYDADTRGCTAECVPELVRRRAHQLFEARGGRSGHELDDWLQAEREIKHHLQP
jgi:Protein of unknown function (DUF2934)